MSDVFGTLKRLFPGVRVTSGYRGPDHPLTRKNPRSWHAQGSPDAPRAIDVAPIPGLSFDQYVSKLRGSGLNVVEALDEARNPSRHATGPHWHTAFGDKQEMPSNYGGFGGRPRLPANLEQRAANFRVDIPPEYYPQQQAQQQPPLAQMAISQGLQMPEKKPETGLFKGNDIAAVAGILGDALMAYGGLQPTFGPGVRQREAAEQEQAYDREKFNAELEMKRQERIAKPIEHTNSAGDVIRIDPSTGRQEVVYLDPYGKPRSESRVNPATGALEIFNTGSTPRPTGEDIADLVRDPRLAQDFDAEFGPGAAAYILRMRGAR